MCLSEFRFWVGRFPFRLPNPHTSELTLPKVIQVPKAFIVGVLATLWPSSLPLESFRRHATMFEDLAVSCARYAHANLPPDVLQAFFHKNVSYPFLRFRLIRHCYFKIPVDLEEVEDRTVTPTLKGIWIRKDATKDPDIVVYYIHGEFMPHPPGCTRVPQAPSF